MKGDTIVCAICGAEFIAPTHNSKCCSEKCKVENKKRLGRKWSQMLAPERKTANLKKEKKKEPVKVMSWVEVAAVCNENNISYGKAKAKGLIV